VKDFTTFSYATDICLSDTVMPSNTEDMACLAKPSCYTWPARRYSLCCPAWQLVCVCMHCIDLFSCKAASVFQ